MAKQSIGEFLATLRKANGYTQQEVADRLGISNRTLSGWECNNVLPDILLLPVLAEMYGVTVDEILAGERKEKTDVVLTDKSEKRILKSKIARFSMQSWILLGIIIVAFALAAVCAFIEATKVSWVGFPWWRVLLILGIITVVVCFSILLAFWKGAEMSVDDTTDIYGIYCLILRKRLANSFYILSATSTLATIVAIAALFVKVYSSSAFDVHLFFTKSVVVCVTFGVVAVALFVAAWFAYASAVAKYGSDTHRQTIKNDRKFFGKISVWCSIPLVLSIILAIVLGCVQFHGQTTIYENADVDEFVKYMETLVAPDGERSLSLSELAKTAKIGEEFDLGDGYFAIYNRYSFTIYNEQIMLLDGAGIELEVSYYKIEVPRLFLKDENGTFSFYNARYYYCHSGEFGSSVRFWFVNEDLIYDVIVCPSEDTDEFVRYSNYSIERVGDGIAYVYNFTHDYSLIGYSVAFPIIAIDVVICATLCVWKRNKFSVKL